MRFSLQTLILATVLLALGLAAFGAFGVAVAVVLVLADAVGRGQRTKGAAIVCAVVMALCGLIATCPLLLFVSGSSGRDANRRTACLNNLKQLSYALLSYHQDHGCFPPAYIPDKDGKPMHSWRVLILPYLGCEDVYRRYNFSEAWDGPNNRRLAARVPHQVFICPSSETARSNLCTTNYLAVVGPDTAWPGAKSFCLDDFEGSMGNTILLVELEDSDVNWMEPRDLSLEEALAKADSDSGLAVHGSQPVADVVMLDASVRALPKSATREDLENLLRTDRDGTIPKSPPTRPKPIWPQVIAALAFLIVFIFYVIRRNKDAAAFAARRRTTHEKNPKPLATTDEQSASESRDPDRPE